MMDLKTYGCTEIEAIPDGLLPGRVTELRRERFTVMSERGEATAVPRRQEGSQQNDRHVEQANEENGGWKK